jgi:hypothetical protein
MDATRRFRNLGLMLGALAGWFVLLLWFQASVDCKVVATEWPKEACHLTKFIFDWQQLLAGLVALIAAGVGWLAIDRQVKQADRLEQERMGAKRAGARAALPAALDAICDYARECAESLALMFPSSGDEGLPQGTRWEGRRLPMEMFLDIRALIETLPLRDGASFAELLSKIQVQSSRLNSIQPSRLPNRVGVIVRSNLEQYIVDSADIYARSEAFFPYARGESEDVPHQSPTRDNILSALRRMGSMDSLPRIEERVDRYYAARRAA